MNGTEKPDIGFYSFLNLISKYYAAQCATVEETIYNVDEQMKKLYKEEYLKENGMCIFLEYSKGKRRNYRN